MIYGRIFIDHLRIHANHGVADQERAVGNDFDVTVSVDYPADRAAETDNITQTIDYSLIVEIVKREMAVPSNLLENVAWRIGRALRRQWPMIKGGYVEISKLSSPIANAFVRGGISVRLDF